jgi:DNA modification methylase
VFIGIDQDAHYLEIARRRIARRHLLAEPEQEADTEHSGQSVMALEAD